MPGEKINRKAKQAARLSLALSDEQRRFILFLKKKLGEQKLDSGQEETLRDFVWSAVIEKADRRKWRRE